MIIFYGFISIWMLLLENCAREQSYHRLRTPRATPGRATALVVRTMENLELVKIVAAAENWKIVGDATQSTYSELQSLA